MPDLSINNKTYKGIRKVQIPQESSGAFSEFAYIDPTPLEISENGRHDVTHYGSVNVNVPASGVDLPTLTNPGTDLDLAKGKQLIGANGEVITGSVQDHDRLVGWGGLTPEQDGQTVALKFESNTPRLFRKGVYMSSPLSNFGDAKPSEVLKGRKFTSAEGLSVEGEMEPSSGVELPTLDTPAEEADVKVTKQYIDGNGVLRTGTMSSLAFAGVVTADEEDSIGIAEDDNGIKYLFVSGRTTNTETKYVSPNSNIVIMLEDTHSKMSEFGDAAAEDVRAGKTFTSQAGFVKVGTCAFRDIKTVTIEEV